MTASLPPYQNVSAQVLADGRLETMKSQIQMLRHEKRESDDMAYRESCNAKRLSGELISLRDKINAL